MNSYQLAKLMLDDKSKPYQQLQERLKKIDVSAYLSDELQVPECGYNCLHLSVLEENIYLTRQLLDRGADLLKQGTLHGYSPLLRFIIEQPYNEGRKVDQLHGKLEKHPMVDLLLNEQVRKNQAVNPKCSKRLSHLHIACMVNHSQAVELFIKSGESVNQAIDASASLFAGYTPLHMAVRYSSVASAKLLISHGADINQKDAKGSSPLHLLIQHLILAMNYINMGKSAPPTQLVEESQKLEIMVTFILTNRKKNKVNFVDDLGLSALHVACTLRTPSMVQEILKTDIDVNKSLVIGSYQWSGLNALHFAACCSVETVKLLIQHGGDIGIKTPKGVTPLDLCMRRYSPSVIHSILSTKEEYRQTLLSDSSTKLLHLLLAMDNCDKFNLFLQNMKDVNAFIPLNSPIWPGCNALHLAVMMHEKIKDPQDYMSSLFTRKSSANKPKNCSEDEDKSFWKRIVVCLARKCSLNAKNAAGLTPVHLAFYMLKTNIVDKLLNSCCSSSENVVDESYGLSFLHMACVVGNKKLVDHFVDDINTPVRVGFEWNRKGLELLVPAGSTPLHIAVFFGHREIVELLLQKKNVNIHARDSLGFTPIHLSAVSQSMFSLFPSKTSYHEDVVSNDGLSYLHVAALVDDDKVIEMLVRNRKKSANVNVAFRPRDDFGKFIASFVRDTPLHVAVKNGKLKPMCALIQAGADIHAASSSSKYDTPLQAAMRNENNEFIEPFAKKLRRVKLTKEPMEPCGVTLLHFACAVFDYKWAETLLEKGADPNAQICSEEDYQGDWKGFAALHVLLSRAKYVIEEKNNLTEMVRLLLKYDADVTLQDNEGYSPVLMADKLGCEALPKVVKPTMKKELKVSGHLFYVGNLLLESQQSFAINPTTHREGSTHFEYACKMNKLDIVKKFLRTGKVNINHAKHAVWKEDGGFTALHFVTSRGFWDVVWLLLQQNADVTVRDLHGNTPLHLAAKNNVDDVRLLEKMCSLGADVEAKNYDGATPLDMLLHSDCISYDEFKFFLDRGCSLELNDESNMNVIGLLMSNADPLDRKDILLLMFESCGLAEEIKNGFNAIQSLVGFESKEQWKLSRRWTVAMFVEAIQFFIDMGCDVNQQNSQGMTALHEALIYCNIPAAEALLLLGANINIKNKHGQVPMFTPICKTNSEQDASRLSEYLVHYAWKMKYVGLQIHFINELAVDGHGMWNAKMEDCCRNELKKTEKTKVGENWTLKDFLSDSRAVIEYQLLSLEKRQSIDKFFKDQADLRKKFPELCGVLMMQYRKAVYNVNYYWPVKNVIASLIKQKLPEKIFIELLDYVKKALRSDKHPTKKYNLEEFL